MSHRHIYIKFYLIMTYNRFLLIILGTLNLLEKKKKYIYIYIDMFLSQFSCYFG